mmetsp:Transcript_17608/g.33662  ORF Transcript_17608/g.33662 Transcript_17608/m.33662 type:complete len:252 (+) Transcript_17608:144-899(+)
MCNRRWHCRSRNGCENLYLLSTPSKRFLCVGCSRRAPFEPRRHRIAPEVHSGRGRWHNLLGKWVVESTLGPLVAKLLVLVGQAVRSRSLSHEAIFASLKVRELLLVPPPLSVNAAGQLGCARPGEAFGLGLLLDLVVRHGMLHLGAPLLQGVVLVGCHGGGPGEGVVLSHLEQRVQLRVGAPPQLHLLLVVRRVLAHVPSLLRQLLLRRQLGQLAPRRPTRRLVWAVPRVRAPHGLQLLLLACFLFRVVRL